MLRPFFSASEAGAAWVALSQPIIDLVRESDTLKNSPLSRLCFASSFLPLSARVRTLPAARPERRSFDFRRSAGDPLGKRK